MKRGFTLIELLVVVLIIGILAAIALPQYQKAIANARAVEILQFVTTAQKALELEFSLNGGRSIAMGEKNFFGNWNYGHADKRDELEIYIPISDQLLRLYSFHVQMSIYNIGQIQMMEGNKGNDFRFNYARNTNTKLWSGSCSGKTTKGIYICSYLSKHLRSLTCTVQSSGQPC